MTDIIEFLSHPELLPEPMQIRVGKVPTNPIRVDRMVRHDGSVLMDCPAGWRSTLASSDTWHRGVTLGGYEYQRYLKLFVKMGVISKAYLRFSQSVVHKINQYEHVVYDLERSLKNLDDLGFKLVKRDRRKLLLEIENSKKKYSDLWVEML